MTTCRMPCLCCLRRPGNADRNAKVAPGQQWPRTSQLDSYYKHEVLDRLFMLQDTLHDFLETHPFVLENSGLQAYLSRAQDALASAYQLAGSIQPSDSKEDKS